MNISESSGGKFYKAVVGTLKHWMRDKLPKSESLEVEKFITLLEDTATADIAKYEQPLGIVTRRPDGVAYDGRPFFDLDDDHIVSKILDGKKKNERWQNLLNDKGIHKWANKNYLKSFHVRTKEGVFIKVR